ncbi:MAG TPA: hypothetical protein VN213_02120, partial [Solirubrobacteraceae bacterium]|nr:hypothetical protein [Solirubrobacteraceae bacterium]
MAATGIADHLAWEARQRRPAAIAALVAAVLTLAGSVYGGILFADVPRSGMLEALERAARPGDVEQLVSLRVPVYQFYEDKAAGVLVSTFMRAIGLLGLGWALTYLAVATRARRPELPRIAQYLPIIGAGLSAVATILSTVATLIAVGDFLDGPRTVAEAGNITQNGLLVTAQLINLPGLLALALALVLISLNAMRTGLLTRFMGVLGMITGALLVFPIGSPLPIVQCFWLLMLGLLFLGRSPGGAPPAWETGEAMPWPGGGSRRQR